MTEIINKEQDQPLKDIEEAQVVEEEVAEALELKEKFTTKRTGL
jgi:hypothetical protein